MKIRPTFEEAKATYVHRYTVEHIPTWAVRPSNLGNRLWPAPHFRTDREWYDNTLFYGEDGWIGLQRTDFYSRNHTWPLGMWLDAPIGGKALLRPTLTAEGALAGIKDLMDGEEWNAATLDAIAELMREAGYRIRDVTEPELETNHE